MPTVISATQWLELRPAPVDPKSPWHDRRVRLAAALAFDKNAINQAETLGHSRPTGSIIPSAFEYALALPPYPYDPARAKKLLAEAGYPNGFEAGDYVCDASYSSVSEAIANYLARSASAPRCVRWSASRTSASGRTRRSARSSRRARAATATPRPASQNYFAQGRPLLVGRPAGHGRPQRPAGPRAGSQAPGGAPAPDPAAGPRARPARAAVGAGLPERHRAARGGVRARAHRGIIRTRRRTRTSRSGSDAPPGGQGAWP